MPQLTPDETLRRLRILVNARQEGVPMAAAFRTEGYDRPDTVVRWAQGITDPEAALTDAERARASTAPLQAVGYDLARGDMTPEEAWRAGHDEFERTVSARLAAEWQVLKRPRGPGVIAHFTDVHVDDPASALRLLEADIMASHDLGAIMCHGGDLLNNWPMAGKLAKQWAEQEATRPMALLRARHYIDMLKPDVWTDGNHEEMNPYLMDLISEWLPKSVLRDYWQVNFVIRTPSKSIRVSMSHKFQKGHSWFHKTHAHLREALETEHAHIRLDGHVHSSGVIEADLPERGESMIGVASAGYKIVDKYARRISRGGGVKLRGRAHWIVYDDQAEGDEDVAKAFKSPRQAEAYLNGLQNLRAA